MANRMSSMVSRLTSGVALLGVGVLGAAGCIRPSGSACPEQVSDHSTAAAPADAPLYTGFGDPYQGGPLEYDKIELEGCTRGNPVPLLIYAPTRPGAYATVVFQHGFMARNHDYDTILQHLASHGFVVVAPQMYEPGLGALLGHPTAQEEADLALQVVDWLSDHPDLSAGVAARTDRMGLAGHSRGGKVAWIMLQTSPERFQAIAGVDPVDGTGGPLGNQTRVVQGTFPFATPSLVIGTGLGGSCAPAGDNHVQFYAASRSPAWHIVVPDQGHADMLDEDAAEAAAGICRSGTNREGMRRLTAGLLTAMFRAELQGDEASLDYLVDENAAPIAIEVEFH